MQKKYLLMLSLLLLGMLAHCHCSRSRLVVTKVLIEVPEGVPHFATKEGQDELRTVISHAIDADTGFNFNAQAQDGHVLKFTFSSAGKVEQIFMSATLSHDNNGEQIEQAAFAHIDIAHNSGQALKKAIVQSLQDISRLSSGMGVDSSHFLGLIDKANAGEQLVEAELLNAIAVLGRKGEQKAVAPLIQLLSQTQDLSIGNACLIALGEFADEKSLNAVITFSERKPPIIRRQAIIAVQRIGGQLAAEWLYVMAHGHEDPAVRNDALTAFKQVEARLVQPNTALVER